MFAALRHIVVLVSALTLIGSVTLARSSTPNAKVVAKGLQFPEGTIFVGDTLYFTDYATSDVLRLVDGNVRTVWHRDGCGANGLVTLAGEVLLACYDSGEVIRMTSDGKILETISHDNSGAGFASPNDLAADAKGGVYFTCSGDSSAPGKVYYRTPQGQVKLVADNLGYANGVAVSRDGKLLYLAESNRHRLLTFSIGINGELSNEAVLVDLQTVVARSGTSKITPDGLRIDANGRLFVGLYEGGGFFVLGDNGQFIRWVEIPGHYHANLAISPDGKRVFVTTTEGTSGGQILVVANPVAN